MKLNFTGKNLEITPAIKTYATEKLQRLERRDKSIQHVNLVFTVENVTQTAEGTLHINGTDLHAKSKSEDLYAAIDELADKLLAQLTKHKEKMTDHR